MIRKFNDHKSAQCCIIDNGTANRTLISYTTRVVEIIDGWLTVNGLYSRTTIKHIGWFMRELGLTYQFAKQLYNDDMKYNIFTGEVMPV